MKADVNHFFTDRWNNILLYFAAYLLLIVAIKGAFSVTSQVLLPLIGILIIVFFARIVLLYFRPISSRNRPVKKLKR